MNETPTPFSDAPSSTNCHACGGMISENQAFCPSCGTQVVAEPAAPMAEPHAPASEPHAPYVMQPVYTGVDAQHAMANQMSPPNAVHIDVARGYVGFWMRFSAGVIDGLLLIIPVIIASIFIPILGPMVIAWLYGALMNSSQMQATVGRMALGIVMTDEHGQRPSFGKATGHYFGSILSALILFIGYFMIAWTPRKQGLHDQMAGTLHYYKVR